MIPFLEIIAALNQAKIHYVVVGGLAVALHGVSRFTQDIDLVLSFNANNLEQAIGVFKSLGLQPMAPVDLSDFADPVKRNEWATEKSMVVLSLGHLSKPLISVDLFIDPPVPFEELSKRVVQRKLGPDAIPVASVQDLIDMKRIAGRPLDLADIEALERLGSDRA